MEASVMAARKMTAAERVESRRAADKRRTLAVVAPPTKAEIIGIRTVQVMLARGRPWIYAMARAGALGAYSEPGQGRRGIVWRFRRSAVEAWRTAGARHERE